MGIFCCGSSSSEKRTTLPEIQSQPDIGHQEPCREPIIELRSFNFCELANATQNFSRKCCVGITSFGDVFRGELEGTKEIVAVERWDKKGSRRHAEFLDEVSILSRLQHPNLVDVIGYCAEREERILVHDDNLQELYYYISRAILYHKTNEFEMPDTSQVQEPPLDWDTRIKIALGIARGLEYMHHTASSGPAVIHRNLEPSNILLDEDFNPKLSEFGLCKIGLLMDEPHCMLIPGITITDYIAPEYLVKSEILSRKSDVYSFGVVLFELITGRRAYDAPKDSKDRNLVSWANRIMKYPEKFSELADPLLQGNFPANAFNQTVRLAAKCAREKKNDRPLMTDVVKSLTYMSSDRYYSSSSLPDPRLHEE